MLVLALAATVGLAGAKQPPVLSYGTDPLQTVEAWSAPAPNEPVVVLVHGSGFRSSAGGAKKLSLEATQLAQAGFAVFDVNYRSDSATVAAFPNEVNDVVNGTKWAIAHANQYHGDPTNVSLIGGSAGGTLAGDAAEAMPGQIHAVVSLSGTNDLGAALASWMAVGGPSGSLHVRNISRAVGCAPALCTQAALAQWSPDARVTSANCPRSWLVLNSSLEEQPVAQAHLLTTALQAKGCTVTERILGGVQHGYTYWPVAFPQILTTLRS